MGLLFSSRLGSGYTPFGKSITEVTLRISLSQRTSCPSAITVTDEGMRSAQLEVTIFNSCKNRKSPLLLMVASAGISIVKILLFRL